MANVVRFKKKKKSFLSSKGIRGLAVVQVVASMCAAPTSREDIEILLEKFSLCFSFIHFLVRTVLAFHICLSSPLY